MQLIKINLNILYLFLLTITSIFFIKSFIVNSFLLILSLISIYYLCNNKVKVFDNSVNKILIILFLYIILNSFINFSQIDLFIKSITQIRFYLLIIFVQIYSSFLLKNIRYFFGKYNCHNIYNY